MTRFPRTPEDRLQDHSPTDEEIGTLLEEAGEHGQIPPEDLEQIVVAAEESWQSSVRRARSSARQATAYRWGVALAATLAVALALVYFQRGPTLSPNTTVEDAIARAEHTIGGTAMVRAGDSSPQPLSAGAVIGRGDLLTTDPAAGSLPGGVSLRLASGAILRLDSGTRARLLDEDRIALEVGAVYFDSGSEQPSALSRISIETTAGVVTDIGTQFSTRVRGGTLQVLVREGQVQLDSEALQPTQIVAGQGVRVEIDGSTTRFDVPSYGPEWSWVFDRSPGLVIESPSIEQYLEWLARESGLEIEIAPEVNEVIGVRFFPPDVDLRSVDGAWPVLLSAGLRGEVQDGVLRVESLE